MGLNDLMHPHANDSDSHGIGKEPALPSKREQDATPYPQNVSSPQQHIFTFQGTKYILSTRRKTLGEWVGAISKVCSGQSFHPEEYFTNAITSIVEAFEASTATCAYSLAVFRRLWRTGGNLHKSLISAIMEGGLLPGDVGQHPTEVLILGTFYWALWVANTTLNDNADCQEWFKWLGDDKLQRLQFQIATLRDLGYNTLLPSDEWKFHLNSLLWVSQPLGDNPKFHFILTELETEIKRASSDNRSV